MAGNNCQSFCESALQGCNTFCNPYEHCNELFWREESGRFKLSLESLGDPVLCTEADVWVFLEAMASLDASELEFATADVDEPSPMGGTSV